MTVQLPIYLDYGATTPVDPRVAQKMIPYLTEKFGNPASSSHAFGWEANQAVEEARCEIALTIGADPREIIFTSGATEADNLAIKGVARYYKDKGRHLITVATEHKAVLDSMRHLEAEGFEVTYLPVMENGLIDLEVLKKAIREDTILVSVMAVNNEIGVIQDLPAIGAICKEKGAFFHVDATQAIGKLHFDMANDVIDLMSLSAHKCYGPKGIGALYVRRRPRVRLDAIIDGGGHERGMRSGTLPTHQIVGMGEAYRLVRLEMDEENKRFKMLRDRLWAGIQEIECVYLNGDMEHRVATNLNVSFAFIEGESLMMALKDVAVSSGSACTSASLEPSFVLKALGRDDELAHSSIRFTLGRFTTVEEIDYVVDLLKKKVAELRAMSPLWEMYKEGVDLKTVAWTEH
ncbi:MAG TPA: IscS subfamily cysteine desulfurase [Sutterella sp.]|nr:IscS subfamily cysteine desulfurase [Sutterella sp.]